MRFIAAGDTAVVVEFGGRIDRALSARVLQLARQVRAAPPAGVIEVVPTFRSLLVHYDPLATSGKNVVASLRALTASGGDKGRPRRRWIIPACYAPELAPDLAEVAERTGLGADEVVARHARTLFHVYMIGFSPGHPYMGDLPAELALPRRNDPRLRVPAGSIAIASTLSVIHPAENPSGWHVIGATPIRLFDACWERPSLLAPGDAVRFDPIGLPEYEAIRTAASAGTYLPVGEEIESWPRG
ncbi:MAG: 5-oxoprolinase subunit PxpB [Rhizobiales bacterium]|nr:5-oxoprolinase subunit PxpB [Hyphomicrobiales bacterium]